MVSLEFSVSNVHTPIGCVDSVDFRAAVNDYSNQPNWTFWTYVHALGSWSLVKNPKTLSATPVASMPEEFTVAGGRIRCKQCEATSKRTKQQCRAPAATNKTKCRFHGGASTGPKTDQGRQRCAEVNARHGRETRKARALRTLAVTLLRDLEDVGRIVGLIHGPKTVGRKPK